ncbi:hypothetical protein SAMN02799624_02697 [Paenibacillus sp. UNC496MF]|uniref:hypothetical protein n=1 Tax=Paenibacillus sp. UNC496MF TaxID=1502753 RepID=UPI0008F08632|nr:hypothetical protein [Paenibacillus sp. UNC496MF]SFI92372.1 hypothetical protein SAMN02799624_02697 [Paenibacillus sp. UNC496MF]
MKLLLQNEEGAPRWIAVEDIRLIAPTPNGPAFTMSDGTVYRYAQTMEELDRMFGLYGFARLDRNVIANVEAAERYDPELRKVFFGQPEGGEGEALYATVSGTNAPKVKHLTAREYRSGYDVCGAA